MCSKLYIDLLNAFKEIAVDIKAPDEFFEQINKLIEETKNETIAKNKEYKRGSLMYKGIFWYDPSEKKLIVKKVACNRDGVALEEVEYSSKSGDNFNHRAEWAKLPRSVTNGQPYNYYPRGRVEIKNNKATVYQNPILDQTPIMEMINDEFGLNCTTMLARYVNDGSEHYGYIMDYQGTVCNMCGKTFEFWDHEENVCLDRFIGYGSKHDFHRIQLNLCCHCFDKVIDWILPQCMHDPMSEYQ